jgi:hypothetical protein
MLERPLNSFNVVGCFANVNFLILWILYAESEPTPFVPTFPTSGLFGEVAIPYADAHVFIIKESSVKLKKVNQMFA